MIFIKRALEYLKKKIGKTILLAIIFIVIANFIIAGLLIQNASEHAQANTRTTIGADISYEMDMGMFLEDLQKGLYDKSEIRQLRDGGLYASESIHNGGGPTIGNMVKLIDSDYVSEYYFSLATSIESDVIAYDVEDTNTNILTLEGYGGNVPRTLGEGEITLVSGDLPDVKGVMISEELAETNKLRLGDSLELTFDFSHDTLTLEITGIYATSEVMASVGEVATYPQNRIYVPYQIFEVAGMTHDDLSMTLLSDSVVRLTDPTYLDLYRSEMQDRIDFEYGYLDANDDLYESLVGPLESIGLITQIFVASIIVTGGFIVGLITALTINDRKNEIGILLAVGESKLKIVGQFVLEVTIIAILAFTLSLFTGEALGESMSETLLSSEIFTTEESNNQAFFKNITAGGMRGQVGGGMGDGGPGMVTQPGESLNIKDAEAAAELKIGLEVMTILQIFGIGLLLTVVSTSIPTIYVMRFSPKQILTNRDS